MTKTAEFAAWRINGFFVAALHLALLVVLVMIFLRFTHGFTGSSLVAFFALVVFVSIPFASGYLTLEPNQAKALILFGRYLGTVRVPGFSWVIPFTGKSLVSLRVRNFTSDTIKVNDANGNPIEIAAVVVWRVTDTGKALFDVDKYSAFVDIQAETALRSLANRFPYDAHDTGESSLLGNLVEVAANLRDELEERLEVAGVAVDETRLTHLAYAPEIAQVMLRRQQADAIIAARQKIVEGAVGMVRMALEQLEHQGVVSLNDERRATMVSNLLVVLTSDQEIQPVLNAGASS